MVNKAVKLGTKLNLELDIPGQGGSVSAVGKVVWVRQGEDESANDAAAGVRFIRMSGSEHQKVLSYLRILEQNGQLDHMNFKNYLAASQAALNLLLFVLKKVLSNI